MSSSDKRRGRSTPNDKEDFYAILGVRRDSSPEQIVYAYRQRVRECHPDLNPNDPRAKEQFFRVQNAFEVLNDPARRAAYGETILRAKQSESGKRVEEDAVNLFMATARKKKTPNRGSDSMRSKGKSLKKVFRIALIVGGIVLALSAIVGCFMFLATTGVPIPNGDISFSSENGIARGIGWICCLIGCADIFFMLIFSLGYWITRKN
jgi:hypothetical protein